MKYLKFLLPVMLMVLVFMPTKIVYGATVNEWLIVTQWPVDNQYYDADTYDNLRVIRGTTNFLPWILDDATKGEKTLYLNDHVAVRGELTIMKDSYVNGVFTSSSEWYWSTPPYPLLVKSGTAYSTLKASTIPQFNNIVSGSAYSRTGVANPNDYIQLPDGYVLDANGNIVKKDDVVSGGGSSNDIPVVAGFKVVAVDKSDPTPDVNLYWTKKDFSYHVELMVDYSYKTSLSSNTKKTAMLYDYFDNIGDIGSYLLTTSNMFNKVNPLNSERDSVISGYIYPRYYIRYAGYINGKYSYGKWRYCDLMGGSKGTIEYEYGDTEYNPDGSVSVKPHDTSTDENGNPVSSGTSFGTLLDGLANAPKVVASLGNGIASLTKSVGTVPLALGTLLVGAPPEIWQILTLGIACMVALGIFKIIRG